MPTPPLTLAEKMIVVRAFVEFREKAAAAQSLDMPGSTFDHRLSAAVPSRDLLDAKAWLDEHQTETVQRDGFRYDAPVNVEEDVGERWERRRKVFRKRRAAQEARTWMPFRMDRVEPCALLWFGDPHLDDDGCDFDALDRAITVARMPGVYSVGIGDYQNNWIGRLARLYGSQETSHKQAWQDVKHFVQNQGINWLTLLKGNHDQWSGAGDPLDYIAEGYSDVAEWRSQFRLVWDNGVELKIDAAHDHKGSSQYSESFGAKKAAYFDGRADIYVCGHKHSFSLDRFIQPHRGTMHEAFRVRGFKYFDMHALVNGFPEMIGAEAMLTVIDPRDGLYFQTFDDLGKGVTFLRCLKMEMAA